MQILSIILVFTGAVILVISTWRYYLVLQSMKSQTYDEPIFNHWVYGASLSMMIFFFLGYIGVGIRFFTSFLPAQLLTAFIFFFGALFVLCMVEVQKTMSRTITRKTTETIQSMVDAMEAKDLYTKGHSEHVCKLVELLYGHLPSDLKQKININKLKDAAILHDVGKIGIPDEILNKPDKLTEEEYEIIKQHPRNGANILKKTSYQDIDDWIEYHHERMDGKGYYNMPASAIPLEARIIAVADTFSALFTDRVYRKSLSFEEAIEMMREYGGTQLDQQLVEIFCNIDPAEIEQIPLGPDPLS